MFSTSSIITKEGYTKIFVLSLLLFIFTLLSFYKISIIVAILLCLTAVFYFNPERIPEDSADDSIISPCDGVVKSITTEKNHIFVEIQKELFEPSLIRSPINWNLIKYTKTNGLILCNHNNLFRHLGNKIDFIFENKKSIVELKIFPYKINSLKVYDCFQKKVKLSDRIGFLPFGTVILKLPRTTELKVADQSKVKAGYTLIGFIRDEQ